MQPRFTNFPKPNDLPIVIREYPMNMRSACTVHRFKCDNYRCI